MVGYRRFLSSTTLFVFFFSAFLIRAFETRNVRVCEPPSISSSDCQDNSERNSTQIERRSLAGGGGRGSGGRGSGGGSKGSQAGRIIPPVFFITLSSITFYVAILACV